MNTFSRNSTPDRQLNARPGLFYGYILVATAFVIQVLMWGVYNSYGIFFNPLLDEFRWSRATISGAASLSQILIGVGAVSMGYLNDRFGPRLLMTASAMVAGLGYFLISQTHSVWQLYLFLGVIVGLGVSGTDVILLSTTARWFVRRRGMMSGIVKIGTGVGIMVAPLVAARLISAYGWRDSFIILGVTIGLLGIAASQFLKRDPAKVGRYPDGETAPQNAIFIADRTGLTLGQAFRTRRFWILCAAFFIILFCTFSVIIHFASYVASEGFPASLGTAMISLIGGVSIAGRLIMGIVGDKIGSKRGQITCFLLLTAAFVWVQFAGEAWGLVVFALIYGFCHGGFYALISPTVAEFFGLRAHGSIFGVIVLAGSLGGALGPLVTGRIVDTAGDYQPAFLLITLLAAVGFISIMLAGPVPERTAFR
jgi:MFS family permease